MEAKEQAAGNKKEEEKQARDGAKIVGAKAGERAKDTAKARAYMDWTSWAHGEEMSGKAVAMVNGRIRRWDLSTMDIAARLDASARRPPK